MKLQLKGLAADLFISFYLFATLFVRFQLEAQLQGRYAISMFIGGFGLLFLWALIKSKFLSPNYFGLIEEKRS